MDPVRTNCEFTASADFTDTGTLDTHTAEWDWGDGSTSAGTVTESNGAGCATGNHTYVAAGVYTIQITVTDNLGASDVEIYKYVVIYNPDGGFVTGGGWINSPTGAYTADPSLAGKANFGFVSKYEKGKTIPTGQTQFQFKMADLNFHSATYEWLVVSGTKAKYIGVGTINGSGEYGFILTAVDGQVSGGGGIDKFRIKIWDQNQGNGVVYDNQMGESEELDAMDAIEGGNIVIHKSGELAKQGETEDHLRAVVTPQEFKLFQNRPNPFNPITAITFMLPEPRFVEIIVYNMLGQSIRHLASSFYSAGTFQTTWDGRDDHGSAVTSGVYFYRIHAGEFSDIRQMILQK